MNHTLYSSGQPLDTSPECFGWLRESTFDGENSADLRERLNNDGYLFLRGLLDPERVSEVRREVFRRLAREGKLAPDSPLMEGVPKAGEEFKGIPSLTRNNGPLETLLYSDRAIAFFETYFGVPVRHFDHTWLRAIRPGPGTYPHCDIVYMGRGTHKLLTMWTPLGDISLDLGGLIILEDSQKHAEKIRPYLERDVDTYCANRENAEAYAAGKQSWNGALTKNPATLREKLGGRWLTAENYRMGDVVVFPMNTIHASLDNGSDRIRLSSDSRYQRADEPADERWIGPHPPGHGKAGKRGVIC